MEFVAIGAFVAVDWVYIDGVQSTSLQLSNATSVPGGAGVLDTRWHSADNAGAGWPDGPGQLNPLAFGNAYSVCFNKLHYGAPPKRCTRSAGVAFSCAGDLSSCRLVGEIGGVANVTSLCWKHTGSDTFVVVLDGAPALSLPLASGCVAVADRSIAVHVERLSQNNTRVTINRVQTEQYDVLSALIAFAFVMLLIVWNETPRHHAHAWLDADIVIAAAFVNWARFAPPAPEGCDAMCAGSTCASVCSVAISSYLLALLGLALPFAIVSTACWRWQPLRRYTAPTFTHATVEIVLLSSSAAHFPSHRMSGDGEALLLYIIAAGICTIAGKAAGIPSVSFAEIAAKAAMCGLVLCHASFSLLRPALQQHPSLDPTDAHNVLATSFVLSATAIVAGAYAAKTTD